MKSKLYSLYDDFYYSFELTYNCAVLRWQEWKSHLGVRYDAAFLKACRDEILPYWARFGVRPRMAMLKSLYDINGGDVDPRYIPDDLWGKYIVPHFNNCRFSKVLVDKNLNSMIYPQVKRPRTLFRFMSGRYCLEDYTPITREQALALCATPGTWVAKPSLDSFQGKNILFFSGTDDPAVIKDALDSFGSADYIVQQAVVQHPLLGTLNSTSVNTVRLMTLVFHEKAVITSSILRVGQPGSRVDNVGSGGWQVNIEPDGSLSPVGYTKASGKPRHETLEPPFAGFRVPSFDRVCQTALALAEKTPHLHLIAWDFSVDQDGDPVLIEFNARSPGQNQETSGPSFGAMTDEVLAEVFAKGGCAE